GEQVALEVIRHHRLLELYLAETLGVHVDDVHAEADRLEHVISEELEERIDRALGFPTHDPHGEPIPDANLKWPKATSNRRRWVSSRSSFGHRSASCSLVRAGRRSAPSISSASTIADGRSTTSSRTPTSRTGSRPTRSGACSTGRTSCAPSATTSSPRTGPP